MEGGMVCRLSKGNKTILERIGQGSGADLPFSSNWLKRIKFELYVI